MLTTGIASGDASSYGQLLATLQQTGLVGSVKQWEIPADKLPDGSEAFRTLSCWTWDATRSLTFRSARIFAGFGRGFA